MKRRTVYQFAALWVFLLVVAGCAVVDHAVDGLLPGPPEVVPLSGGSWLRRLTVTVQDPLGGPIASTGAATSDAAISGIVRAVYIDYTTDAITTTDIVLVGSAPGKADIPILTIKNAATDTWKYPLHLPVNITNTTIGVVNSPQPVYIDGQVTLTVTHANLLDTIEATILYEQLR